LSVIFRAAHLATIASLRAAGPVPWLLAIAWIAIASLQEPVVLRSFGVHLPVEAASAATCVVSLVLATSAPSVRLPVGSGLRSLALVGLVGGIMFGCVLVLAACRGERLPQVANVAAATSITTLVTICYASCAVNLAKPAWLAIAVLHAVLAFLVGMRVHEAGWSFQTVIASIAGLAGATTSTLMHAGERS